MVPGGASRRSPFRRSVTGLVIGRTGQIAASQSAASGGCQRYTVSRRALAYDETWQREMQRYLAHFHRAGKRPTILFNQPLPSPGWTPAMDMYETSEALVIVLDLAGVEADRTEVHAEPHLLVVRGVRRERRSPGRSDEQRSYHALEIPYGRFERNVQLPPGLDTAEARASYHEGLLEITLPKRLAHQVPITIKDATPAS
jgi:HSP20 family protein